MVNYGTKRTHHNENTLPKWARLFIITGGIEGKEPRLGSLNTLPQWARDKIIEIRKYHVHCLRMEKAHREEECKECNAQKKCSPMRRARCDEMRDIPPCG
jgi:hypothetical protein